MRILHYRRWRCRFARLHAARLQEADDELEFVRSTFGFVHEQWSAGQFESVANAFEYVFSMPEHRDNEVVTIRRTYRRAEFRINISTALYLRATVAVENLFSAADIRSQVMDIKVLRAEWDKLCVFGTSAWPACFYQKKMYLVPPTLQDRPLVRFAALSDMLWPQPAILHAGLPTSGFRRLWSDACAWLETSASHLLITRTVFHQRWNLQVPACAFPLAVLRVEELLCRQLTPATLETEWRALCIECCPRVSDSAPPCTLQELAYADVPAALPPDLYHRDAAPRLADASQPDATKAAWCRLCDLSFPNSLAFAEHLAEHELSASAYSKAVRQADARSWPQSVPPKVQRHCVGRYAVAFREILRTPGASCAVCARGALSVALSVHNLRDVSFNLDLLHSIFSAIAYHARHEEMCKLACSDLPANFEGLSYEVLACEGSCVPAEVQALRGCADRWLLFLPTAALQIQWRAAAADLAAPLLLHICEDCTPALQRACPTMPALARANQNLMLPLPAVLDALSTAELLCIAKGYIVHALHTLPARASPEARQKALRGSVIAFPQDARPALESLPRTEAQVAEMLTVFFTSESLQFLRAAKEYTIRRNVVAAALQWLRLHNPFYAVTRIDEAALAALPENSVPETFLQFAFHAPASVTPGLGPAQAQMQPVPGFDALPLHGAVLDSEGDGLHPLHLWRSALTAGESALAAAESEDLPTAARQAQQAAHAAVQLLSSGDHPAFAEISSNSSDLALIVPHAAKPLNSFAHGFWSQCFPHLFPYGDGCLNASRPARLADRQWARLLLLRVDRSATAWPWRASHSFIATLFATLHRRQLLRAVRAKLRAPSFATTVHDLAQITSRDFAHAADVMRACGSVRDAQRSPFLAPAMRRLLSAMEIVSAAIPCTHAARTNMRHQLEALQISLGFPALFLTLNPADTHHPFTLRFALHNSDQHYQEFPLDDSALHECMQDVDLATLIAKDPVAASLAFNCHVQLFLRDLLGCPVVSRSDTGSPSLDDWDSGVLGPVAAVYGITEPQMRGSLHLHMLIHLLGFTSPPRLLQAFADKLPELAARLKSWAASVCCAALESVPTALGVPRAQECLSSLQPLPYSKAHREVLPPHFDERVKLSAAHWRAANSQCPLPAAPPWMQPFDTTSAFLPWPRTYLDFQPDAAPAADWVPLLLYDVRHSMLHCCLHECRPRTCHKGFLGRRGFCRLGFWHWHQIDPASETWTRCHGHALQPELTVGRTPPHRGILLPERHHAFATRFNPCILAACKCNHDITILLRAFQPDEAAELDNLSARMLASLRAATFYVTAYTAKTQPQMAGLWQLLRDGQQTLDAEFAATSDPPARAQMAFRRLTRMLTSCAKLDHRSMPEMLHYLLGFPEAYTSHSFRKVFYTHLRDQALHCLPIAGIPVLPAGAAELLLRPGALPDSVSADTNSPAPGLHAVTNSQAHDYAFRGSALANVPLFFYVAAFDRVPARKAAACPVQFAFDPAHELATSNVQVLRTTEPWFVPQLAGPRIPHADENSELRSLLLLILFKPWSSLALTDLLQPNDAAGAMPCATWTAAFADFEASLASAKRAGALSHSRPALFTPHYWAHRTTFILENMFSLGGRPVDDNLLAIRCPPKTLSGQPGSEEPSARQACEHLDEDSCCSGSAFEPDAQSLPDGPDPVSQPLAPDAWRAAPLFRASWDDLFDCHDTWTGARPAQGYGRKAHAFALDFQNLLRQNSAQPARRDAEAMSFPVRHWTREQLQALQTTELQWESTPIPSSACSSSPTPRMPLPPCNGGPGAVVPTAVAWLQEGRCSKPDGSLNHKQAAYLLLHAAALEQFLLHRSTLRDTPPPTQSSILLGGPGTGKTRMTNMVAELLAHFLPAASCRCAFTHAAARLVQGQTLHAALKLPLGPFTPATKTLGASKEHLLEQWSSILAMFIDEFSMLPADLVSRAEFRTRQVKHARHQPWGGLSVHFSGDPLQLPPVKADSLTRALIPPPSLQGPELQKWKLDHRDALQGLELWQQIPHCIVLQHSHRCQDSLQQILTELRLPGGQLSPRSWRLLQSRLLQPEDARVRSAPFTADTTVVGVLRHSARVIATRDRALFLAKQAEQRLLVSIAADRANTQDGIVLTDPVAFQYFHAKNSLSQTANSPGQLFLWKGCWLLLQRSIAEKPGLVKGCRVQVVDIILDDAEPAFDAASTLPPHVLQFVPEALIVRVPDAAWHHQDILLPGEAFVTRRTSQWKCDIPAHALPLLSPAAVEATLQQHIHVHRLQLPFTNYISCTAHILQGATLSAMLADLAQPPGCSRDEFWLSAYVLLSRLPSLDCLLLYRLPCREAFSGGPPQHVLQELDRLQGLEAATLANLHDYFADRPEVRRFLPPVT